jgi:hypothetical protein
MLGDAEEDAGSAPPTKSRATAQTQFGSATPDAALCSWQAALPSSPELFTMSLQDFKVFTFDLVGTLIDFEGGMPACLHLAVPEARVTDEDFLAHTVPDYHFHTLAESADAVEAGR